MRIETADILNAVAIGVGATAFMDVWNVLLKRAIGVPSLDYCLLGRWLRHMPTAFRHASIAAAAPRSYECTAGWLAHYSIGISLAVAFILTMGGAWLARPTLLPALMYGIGTVVFPFFVMQPALGLGIASANVPKPMQARLKSLVTHAVFGAGLYVCALAVTALRAPR